MKYLSLPINQRYKLNAPLATIWVSDNPLVVVKNGWVYAERDSLYPNSQATITAKDKSNNVIEEFKITIINWKANSTNLELVKKFEKNYHITKNGDKFLVSIRNTGLELFETTDLESLTKICDLPEALDLAPILITPHGYFIRTYDKVFRSKDLKTWTLSATVVPYTLRHGFDFYYDSNTNTTYVYTSEYNTDSNIRHKIHKGVITDNSETWSVALDLYSRSELQANPLLYPCCWHIHAVTVDKSNGYVWVMVGDFDNEARILYSKDNGLTFSQLGCGSQEWRALSMWFTTNYIYWNMDADKKQKIFRIPRSWVDVKTQDYINLNKEVVAEIECGSLWYHSWMKDNDGNDIVIHTSSAEGYRRDYNARVFMFKEKLDGTVTNEEVLLVVGKTPTTYNSFLQMEPFAQDKNGFIYMGGRGTDWVTTWKYRLVKKGVNKLYRFI